MTPQQKGALRRAIRAYGASCEMRVLSLDSYHCVSSSRNKKVVEEAKSSVAFWEQYAADKLDVIERVVERIERKAAKQNKEN